MNEIWIAVMIDICDVKPIAIPEQDERLERLDCNFKFHVRIFGVTI